MATVINYVPTVFHSTAITQLTTTYSKPPHFCFFKQLRKPTLLVATRVEVTASSSSLTKADEKEVNTNTDILACPICYNQLIDIGDPGLTVKTIPGPNFQCNTCKKSYDSNDTYLDLTVAGGAKQYSEYIPPSTELFRTPLVSFLYERGWRQSFSILFRFPGPDKEFELAKDYLKPVLGGNIIDASCGSGLFTRLFAKSGLFSLVVALDFSENMLRQSYEFIKQEDGIPEENLILVRADIARLPFVSSSVDAVHAGAAVHCWPSPSAAVAEISRVLRPGGVFVATTYILDGIYGTVPLLKTLRQNIGQAAAHIFLSERELEDLCEACGLVNFTCARNGPFIMLSATKPC